MILVRIALTAPKKFKLTASIIKWRLQTDYCHACIISQDSTLGVYDVSQAAHGMVHEMDLDVFNQHNRMVKVFHVALSEEQFIRGRQWLKKQRGKGYSVLGALSSTFGFLRRLGIGRDGDQEFICSEFAFRFLEVSLGKEMLDSNVRADDYVDPYLLEGVLNHIQNIAYQRASCP